MEPNSHLTNPIKICQIGELGILGGLAIKRYLFENSLVTFSLTCVLARYALKFQGFS